MSKVMDYFKTLIGIPHCSREADALKAYLCRFGEERGYTVESDRAKNILIRKGKPGLCLQAHYDMVCIGKAPEIETYEEEGWLSAKASSLGADNGIAIAMMMQLMDEGRELEFLFTSNEEIGLVGANALSFELHAHAMLNLDSEDEAEVYIGCAGGVDIVASKPYALQQDDRQAYKVTVSGLPGGHSGVDIDKNIPNAIKLLAGYLKDKKVGLVSLNGGERRNSIPAEAFAVVKSDEALQGNSVAEVEKVDNNEAILYGGEEIIALLNGFPHGVRAMNEALRIPDKSINLAIVHIEEGRCRIETSARAMSPEGLVQISEETNAFFKSYGYDVRQEDKYPSWKPEINSFTELVGNCMEEVYGKTEFKAIHAGLECGVIAEKYPSLKIASIGPTIRYPHSTREKVDIDSVEKTFKVVKKVIERS